MKIIDYINFERKPFFSIEITPPLKTKSIKKIFQVIDRLIPYNPKFINVTYHQEAISSEEVDGIKTKIVYQKHASTVGVCAAIKYKYNIEVVPHLICGGFDKLEVEDALFDLIFLGIDNVLALRGDPRKNQTEFTPHKNGHRYASELVKQIADMHTKEYLHQLHPKDSIDFCIGVAGYPEKHNEAENMQKDIEKLKHKVEQGADYIVTQMFFDFDKFVEWERLCRKNGITIPIIPGLKPITKKKQMRRFTENFNVHMPEKLVKEMNNCHDSEKAYEIGLKHMIELSNKLIDYGVPGIHFFTMGNGRDVEEIAKKIFVR